MLLDNYKTTYTDSTLDAYLANVYDHMPPKVYGRSAWVAKEMPEAVAFGANVQTRVLQPSIVVATALGSNSQATDEQDAIVDAIIDLAKNATVAAAMRAVTGGPPLLPAGVQDGPELSSESDGTLATVHITFAISPGEGY